MPRSERVTTDATFVLHADGSVLIFPRDGTGEEHPWAVRIGRDGSMTPAHLQRLIRLFDEPALAADSTDPTASTRSPGASRDTRPTSAYTMGLVDTNRDGAGSGAATERVVWSHRKTADPAARG